MASVRYASRSRCYWRQVAATVKIRSTKMFPLVLSAPKQPLRHKTAGRKACSAALLVGSIPSTITNVHNAGSSFLTSLQNARTIHDGSVVPRSDDDHSRHFGEAGLVSVDRHIGPIVEHRPALPPSAVRTEGQKQNPAEGRVVE
jgi:hypothetical protein